MGATNTSPHPAQPVTAAQPVGAAQEKTRPSHACGHQVMRFMKG